MRLFKDTRDKLFSGAFGKRRSVFRGVRSGCRPFQINGALGVGNVDFQFPKTVDDFSLKSLAMPERLKTLAVKQLS